MAFTFAGVYQDEFQDQRGNRLAGASVLVRKASDGLTATLYTDRTKATGAANPFTVDADGNGEFYADPGDYLLDVTYRSALLKTGLKVQVAIDPTEAAQDSDVAALELDDLTDVDVSTAARGLFLQKTETGWAAGGATTAGGTGTALGPGEAPLPVLFSAVAAVLTKVHTVPAGHFDFVGINGGNGTGGAITVNAYIVAPGESPDATNKVVFARNYATLSQAAVVSISPIVDEGYEIWVEPSAPGLDFSVQWHRFVKADYPGFTYVRERQVSVDHVAYTCPVGKIARVMTWAGTNLQIALQNTAAASTLRRREVRGGITYFAQAVTATVNVALAAGGIYGPLEAGDQVRIETTTAAMVILVLNEQDA